MLVVICLHAHVSHAACTAVTPSSKQCLICCCQSSCCTCILVANALRMHVINNQGHLREVVYSIPVFQYSYAHSRNCHAARAQLRDIRCNCFCICCSMCAAGQLTSAQPQRCGRRVALLPAGATRCSTAFDTCQLQRRYENVACKVLQLLATEQLLACWYDQQSFQFAQGVVTWCSKCCECT